MHFFTNCLIWLQFAHSELLAKSKMSEVTAYEACAPKYHAMITILRHHIILHE